MVIVFWGMLTPVTAWGQGVGGQAEMDRLEEQAQNLAAQNDPEGAALAIGKAAMMADLLTKDTKEPQTKNFYQAAAYHYRGQEFGLRALALFNRAGGQAPAAPGVCQYLVQGHNKLEQARMLLEEKASIPHEEGQIRQHMLLQNNEEWKGLFHDLHDDFACDLPAE